MMGGNKGGQPISPAEVGARLVGEKGGMGESRNGQPRVLGMRKKGTCWSCERRHLGVERGM